MLAYLPSQAESRHGQPLPVRLTVRQYHRMIDACILPEGEPIELLEGWLIPKMTKKPPHDVAIDLARTVLDRCLPKGWRLRIQSAITTGDSEPEPDLAIVRGPARRYVRSHPRPPDLGLVAEVADASLPRDRSLKARVYARARIPEYWIINLVDRQVERYTDPQGGRNPSYRVRVDYPAGGRVPLILGGRRAGLIPVEDLLP